MTPDEARSLLGAYATGTLTAEEQQALFAAALEDQSLFDELAREQALKEALDDPAIRGELLGALTAPKRAWWRSWMLPVGAGAVALASLTVMVMVRSPRQAAVEVAENRATPPAAAVPGPIPEPLATTETRPKDALTQPAARRQSNEPAKELLREAKPALDEPAKPAGPATARRFEPPAQPAQPSQISGAGIGDQKAKSDVSQSQAGQRSPSAQEAQSIVQLAEQANIVDQRKVVTGAVSGALPASPKAAAAPPPAIRAATLEAPAAAKFRSADAARTDELAPGIRHSVEAMGDGRFRLSLRSRENGYIYLFHKAGDGGWTPVISGGTRVQAQISFVTPPIPAGQVNGIFSKDPIADPDRAVSPGKDRERDADGRTTFTITLK